jgi:three-Cys-motif partner protein
MGPNRPGSKGPPAKTSGEHRFGGRHTDDKLERLRQYLQFFATALKNQGFVLVYIDACAGSGGRAEVLPALPLLGGDDASPQTITVPGSARLAMEVVPPFDHLLLVESDPERYATLERLAGEFPQQRIECHRGDANKVVHDFCRKAPWRGSKDAPRGMRGVVLLDPYGMQIDWATVEAIAVTESLDLWYFFPLMGLYRQAANAAPAIDANKRARLNRVLGTEDWERAWYDTPHGLTDLFGQTEEAVRTADAGAIERYVMQRLESVFKGAVLDPLRIYNDRGLPIASLFFAIANPNPNAVKLATRIAKHILGARRQATKRSKPRGQ